MTIQPREQAGQTPNIRQSKDCRNTEVPIMYVTESVPTGNCDRGLSGKQRGRKQHGLTVPPEKRFWSKVNKADPSGCWLWTSTQQRGYGVIAKSRNGARKQSWLWAHRFAWELANGSIPAGLIVRHRCDVPLCVNPSHLKLGTQADNVRDQIVRHRLTFGRAPLPPAGLRQQVVEDEALQAKRRRRASHQASHTLDLDTNAVMHLLGLRTPYAVYDRVQMHGLPATRVGGNWVFRRKAVERWQERVGRFLPTRRRAA